MDVLLEILLQNIFTVITDSIRIESKQNKRERESKILNKKWRLGAVFN